VLKGGGWGLVLYILSKERRVSEIQGEIRRREREATRKGEGRGNRVKEEGERRDEG
jgi:hypothetical protein